MRIDRLRIEGFRSLYEVEVNPRPLTILIGPNNAGKSTLAEAIDFLGDVATAGLEVAVARKGGYDNIAHRRQRRTRRAVSFHISSSIPPEEMPFMADQKESSGPLNLDYSFAFRAAGEARAADFSVVQERLVVSAPGPTGRSRRLALVDRDEAGVKISTRLPKGNDALRRVFQPLDDRGYAHFLVDRTSPTSLVLNDLEISYLIYWFLHELGNARIYRLSPVECRKAGSPTPNPHLDTSGGNLPAVARYMRQELPEPWTSVLTAMRGIVPGLNDIESDFTSDRRLTLLFHEKGFGRPWTSAEVSDGTIQSLALFTALFDPRVPTTMIEEPENSVHPWIVRTFVDACRLVSGKQVIVTTHSPALIAYVQPRDVTVMWRRAGRSHLSPLVDLDPQAQELWASGDFSAFDLTDAGLVRQTVPEGFV